MITFYECNVIQYCAGLKYVPNNVINVKRAHDKESTIICLYYFLYETDSLKNLEMRIEVWCLLNMYSKPSYNITIKWLDV